MRYDGIYNVVITARSFGEKDDEPFAVLTEAGCETRKIGNEKPLSAEELIPFVQDADALIVGNDTVDAQVIQAGKHLRVISRYGVGYDNIDLAAASRRGIVVTNTPDTNTEAVADLAFTLMLSLARQIPAVTGIVQQGKWDRVQGVEFWGKTLGIIGLGRIGKSMVYRAKGFNMKVLCYEKFPDVLFAQLNGVRICELDELLAQSDFISVHVPLLPSTRHLIDAAALSLMKPGAFIVNTARGGVIDESALFEALKSGRIAGAGLDVFEQEPPLSSPLRRLPNCLITPHIGGYTAEAIKRMGVLAAKNVAFTLMGKPGATVVNG
jgi:D-3-phosphoglycerate dehydrogenase